MKSQVLYGTAKMRNEMKPAAKSTVPKRRAAGIAAPTPPTMEFQSVPNLALKPAKKETAKAKSTSKGGGGGGGGGGGAKALKKKATTTAPAANKAETAAPIDDWMNKKKVLDIVDKPKKKAVKKAPAVEVKTAANSTTMRKVTGDKKKAVEKTIPVVKCASATEKPAARRQAQAHLHQSPHKSIFDVLKPVKISNELLKSANAKTTSAPKKALRKKATTAERPKTVVHPLPTPISSQ